MNNNEFRLNLVTNYLFELDLSENIRDYFHNRTILVTGGAGAIGTNLVIPNIWLIDLLEIENQYFFFGGLTRKKKLNSKKQ